jgi:hypothetical protein
LEGAEACGQTKEENEMNEKRVRELVRLEIMEQIKPGGLLHTLSQPASVVVTAARGGSSVDDDEDGANELPVDKIARKMAADGLGPLAVEYDKRVEMGMNHDLALVMAQKDQGFDMTPEGFDIPMLGSYFDKHADGVEGVRAAKFTDSFIAKIKDGSLRDAAYEEVCNEMGLNNHKKTGPYKRIFDELPAVAGGAFRKSLQEAREEVEQSFDSPRLLGGGSLGSGSDE